MKTALLIGVSSCLGGNKKGCELGPAALRKYLIPSLQKHKIPFIDLGDISVPKRVRSAHTKKQKIKHWPEIQKLYENFLNKFHDFTLYSGQYFPVLLGGDHSINYAFLSEFSQYKNIGLLWFDAHADFNTPATSLSGNFHGMVLNMIAQKIPQENIALIGIRKIDKDEENLLKQSQVHVIPMEKIQKNFKPLHQVISKIARQTEGIHISIDLDALDPTICPAVSTPVKKGFKKTHFEALIRILKKIPLTSIDIVELDPKRDKKNKTTKFAVKLIEKFIKIS